MIMASLLSAYSLILVIILALIAIRRSDAKLCDSPVCTYDFVIRRERTMTYRDGDGVLYNVEAYATQLRVVGNTYRTKRDFPLIGTLVPPDDVITADGFPRNVITVNGQFPGPTIEVYEGTQVRRSRDTTIGIRHTTTKAFCQ